MAKLEGEKGILMVGCDMVLPWNNVLVRAFWFTSTYCAPF